MVGDLAGCPPLCVWVTLPVPPKDRDRVHATLPKLLAYKFKALSSDGGDQVSRLEYGAVVVEDAP